MPAQLIQGVVLLKKKWWKKLTEVNTLATFKSLMVMVMSVFSLTQNAAWPSFDYCRRQNSNYWLLLSIYYHRSQFSWVVAPWYEISLDLKSEGRRIKQDTLIHTILKCTGWGSCLFMCLWAFFTFMFWTIQINQIPIHWLIPETFTG